VHPAGGGQQADALGGASTITLPPGAYSGYDGNQGGGLSFPQSVSGFE
jgi:hypothetical protein